MYRRKRSYGITILLAVLSIVLFCGSLPVLANSGELTDPDNNYNILFISSYSYSWPTVPLQIEGIQSVMDDSVNLQIEFMDTKMISEEIAENELLERIRCKEQKAGLYDAVIVGDDAALVFAMKYQEELFKEIPIVFEGINNIEYAREVSKDPYVSGVIERFSYKDNLDFARKIQPKADKVVALVDDTVTGIGEQQQFFAQEENYPDLTFDVINGSLLTKEQIIEKISEINEDTILLYLILSEDAEGHIYSNEQICHMLAEYAKVPVLRFVQAGIGNGVLGGNIVLHKASGEIAGKMAIQMLESTDPSEIDMQSESPNGFYLDQKVLDRFDIPESLVPENAEIINKIPGFWEVHGKVICITIGVAVGLMLAGLLIMRAVYMRRRREELEKKNQQLETAVHDSQAAAKAKSEFLHSMSHDIRTPMNAIIGFTTIAMKQNTDENVGMCLEKIASSSEHLLTLINDVLDISRIESGKAAYTPVPSNLCALTQAVLDITQGFLTNRHLEFRVERPQPAGHCFVLADPVRIREVLVNILSNAVKYTPDGGTIVFSMGTHPGNDDKHIMVWFKVADTGCGMSEEFLPHIFDEFSQEESGARTQYKGTGLGMAITKRYVDMMNGTIVVESKKGKGTTFTVQLPMELSDADIMQKQNSAVAQADLKGVRILMAEDNDLNAEIALIQLEEAGAQVVRAVDGKEVTEIFADYPAGTFDVILMDIMMPQMNGYEATKVIRTMDDRPDGRTMPIIAMTANAFTEDIQASLDAGMNAHIAKPIVIEEVIKTIAANLR